MRKTQGQAAFGHNVQTIISYSIIVKTGTVGRVFSMRVVLMYSIVQTPTKLFDQLFVSMNIPGKLSCSAKQHPSNSAHLTMPYVLGLSIYVYQFFIPTDFRAKFPTCATRGAVWLAQAHTQAFQTPP
jgi:hypothetical protein